ncbi:MAG TPA: hypothetical protein VLR71_03900 [Casimicrobiaceae bacterium]|nr:hypothetical protein [Casimicrobiaceae bacterium]
MNRYAPCRPRAAFAMIAVALAALNFAVLVALPAVVEAPDDRPATLASVEEPHVDSGAQVLERVRAARERRHDLVARGVGNAAHASDRLWARSPD